MENPTQPTFESTETPLVSIDYPNFSRVARGGAGVRPLVQAVSHDLIAKHGRQRAQGGVSPDDSGTAAEDGCVLVRVEYRNCDIAGQTVLCRCELWQCGDSTSYWLCEEAE